MMRRTIIAVVACAGLLALSVPVASADVANVTANVVCTGTAEWNVNLAGAHADMSVTSSTCKRVDASVEDNGNAHLDTSDVPWTGSHDGSLLGVTVTGTNSFVGIANGSFGVGPLEVVSPNILNATLQLIDPSDPEVATAEHVGLGSCGTNCYRTQVRWVQAYDRLP